MRLLLFVLSLFVVAHSNEVTVLETEDLREFFVEYSHIVIFTHNAMCVNCRQEMAIYKSVVESMSFSTNPRFFVADCSITNRVCRRYKARQHPSVLIIKKDRSSVRYTGSMNSAYFRLFLLRNLSSPSSVISSVQLRIIFLVIILVALVLLFLKTMRSNYSDSRPINAEEHAPLVEHPLSKPESQV